MAIPVRTVACLILNAVATITLIIALPVLFILKSVFKVRHFMFSHLLFNILSYRCKVVIQASESEAEKSSENKSKAKKTISRVAYNIWKNEGIPGFFKGLEAQILKTVLSSALLLMIKEKITKTTWVIMLALRRYLLASRPKLKSA